jgi:hypothetical protein
MCHGTRHQPVGYGAWPDHKPVDARVNAGCQSPQRLCSSPHGKDVGTIRKECHIAERTCLDMPHGFCAAVAIPPGRAATLRQCRSSTTFREQMIPSLPARGHAIRTASADPAPHFLKVCVQFFSVGAELGSVRRVFYEVHCAAFDAFVFVSKPPRCGRSTGHVRLQHRPDHR